MKKVKKLGETMQKVKDQFLQLVDDYKEQAISMRRYLHQYPETAGCEKTTTNYIKERLQESDIEVVDSPFHTGLVAKVNGKTGGKILSLIHIFLIIKVSSASISISF